MRPNKIGQIVKFHTPLPNENPNQLYFLLEIKGDVERQRADIVPIDTGFTFPPLITVILDDLIIVDHLEETAETI